MTGKTNWNDCKSIAKAILHERPARRKILWQLLSVVLVLLGAGLWLLDGWMTESPWFFLLWWCGCGALTCMVLLFAVYDALTVIREEKEKNR